MTRSAIARLGALVAAGFLAASATANFMFGASLGRTPLEGVLIGVVGVFAVAMNALSPFFLSWSLAASRRAAAASVVILWALCLIYSTASALGFAAQNREEVAASREMAHDAYADTRRALLDLEQRRKEARRRDRWRLEARIDELRNRLVTLRSNAPAPADAQAAFLSALTFGVLAPRQVRMALVALFALMVEMGATLGMFAALSHTHATPAPTAGRWQPKAG